MRQKKALNGSHLEVFLAPQCSTEHDFDLSISIFLTLFDCCKKLKRNRKEVMLLSFKYVLKHF